MADFYHKMERVRIRKPDGMIDRVPRAIRLYCEQHGRVWNLQIRGPLGIGWAGLKDGKSDAIATASLRREDAEALRDALNEALEEK